MLDDFFIRALIAGIGIAIISGPLGCFVIWRRMAYFGDTMAHSALLGVAFGVLLNMSITVGVFVIAASIALILILLQRRGTLSTDSLLGILSHSTLALGLVIIALMPWMKIDLMSYLFGDILAVSKADILMIYLGAALVLGLLIWIWRPLLAATVNEELAEAEAMQPEKARIIFMLLLAGVIAIAMKIVGILLITALLIIPAATARQLATGPEQMVLAASIIGVICVIAGLSASLGLDTPSGPSIVVAAFLLFMMSQIPIWSKIISFIHKRSFLNK